MCTDLFHICLPYGSLTGKSLCIFYLIVNTYTNNAQKWLSQPWFTGNFCLHCFLYCIIKNQPWFNIEEFLPLFVMALYRGATSTEICKQWFNLCSHCISPTCISVIVHLLLTACSKHSNITSNGATVMQHTTANHPIKDTKCLPG